MKVCIVTDTHFGVRGSSRAFAKNQSDFWDFFWKEIDKRNDVVAILHGGDVYDKRKSIDFLTFADSKKDFFDPARERNLRLDLIVGNHCVYYKNKNEVNSLELLLSGYENVSIYASEPKTIDICGRKIDMIPWFHNELYEKTLDFIKNSESEVMLGHLELSGFEFHRGIVNKHGLDKKPFSRYQLVMSGHFHTQSNRDNIKYLGATSEYTWSDYDDPRGFHFLDLETLELEFVRNPFPMFYRLVVDKDFDFDVSVLEGKVVKLIQGKDCDSKSFLDIVSKVRQVGPEELDTIETSEIDLVESDLTTEDVELSSTSDFIREQVESLESLDDGDRQELISFFNDLYLESLDEDD